MDWTEAERDVIIIKGRDETLESQQGRHTGQDVSRPSPVLFYDYFRGGGWGIIK